MPGPPTLLLLGIGAEVLLHQAIPVATLPRPLLRLLGLAPLLVGIALNLLADRSLKAANTTVKPGLATTTLLTTGVYGLTRNPMYLGFTLILAGLWALLGSLSPGLAVAAVAWTLDHYFMRPEEEKLSLTFGEGYAAYRRGVRRWA